MKRMWRMALALACALGATSIAQGQATIGVGAGLTLPMGDYGDVASVGFHGTGNVTFALGAAPVALRLDAAYHRTGLQDGVDGNTQLLGGLVSAVYNVPSSGKTKPYFLAGLGYYNTKLDVTGVGSADDSNVAFGGGVGIAIALTGTSVFVEARVINVSESDTFTATTFIPITVGIRFGGK